MRIISPMTEDADASQSYLPTSVQLAQMLDRAQGPRVSIGWLVEELGRRSFGLTLFVMAEIGRASCRERV